MQLETLFTEMADALRTKEETTSKISAESFPQRIKDLKVLDTSDATATADEIVAGKIAYANGKRVIGSIIDNGTLEYTPSDEEQIIPAGKTSGGVVKAIDSKEVVITPSIEEQVKEGLFNKVTVGAIKTQDLTVTPSAEEQKFTGLFKNVTVEPETGGIDTSDATATAEDILEGKTAYVNGEKIEGVLKNVKDGYEELEYIGFSFGQSFDTGIKLIDMAKWTIEMDITYIRNGYKQSLIHSHLTDAYNLSYIDTSSNYGAYFGENATISAITSGVQTKIKHAFYAGSFYTYINGAFKKESIAASTSFGGQLTLKFGHAGPTYFNGYLHSFKVYSGFDDSEKVLVFDGVPVKRKSDGVIGLYERVTGKFVTNGIGSFAGGNMIGDI